jgi:hypothetical protein
MEQRTRTTRRNGLVALTLFAAFTVAMILPTNAFAAAISTTTNPGVDNDATTGLPQLCLNGGSGANTDAGAINCNIYTDKTFVWLSGLPVSAALGAGTYFFTVLVPGGQPNPNDGAEKNLSDTYEAPYGAGELNDDSSSIPSGDLWSQRMFTVGANGAISACPTNAAHTCDTSNNKIRLFPYDDTTNNGGVYILAVCKVPTPSSSGVGAPGVTNASPCKYDAFKVRSSDPTEPAADLVVTKDASPSFTRDYDWGVTKTRTSASTVNSASSSVSVNYQVDATWSGPSDSGWQVTGTITVFNPNDFEVAGVDVTDAVNNGGTCEVTGGVDATVPAGESVDFDYTCGSYPVSGPTPNAGENTAEATWDKVAYQTPNGSDSWVESFTFDTGSTGNPTVTHACTTVTDAFNGGAATTLGTVCQDGVTTSNVYTTPGPLSSFSGPTYNALTKTWRFTYSRSVTVVVNTCTPYPNLASISPDGNLTNNTSSASVTVCGHNTGGLTIGYWGNKNGQAEIKAAGPSSGTCSLATTLRAYAPFQDLSATATCTAVATYVSNVIKAANASGASMNAMLKAQMLATALDVALSHLSGSQMINLTQVCKNISTCSIYENVSSSFGGATSLSISAMLTYAASQSNPGGTMWYGNVKAVQELAKDAFDAINNNVAFAA